MLSSCVGVVVFVSSAWPLCHCYRLRVEHSACRDLVLMPCCEDRAMIASGRMHVRLAGHKVPSRHVPRTGGSHMSNVPLSWHPAGG
jgi:hypothetical protein